jgi:hypothetical protein
VTEIRISLARQPQTTGGGLPNDPRKFSRFKARIMALLLGALLIGFTIAAIILGSIVAAGILILVAALVLMAILRSVFRRIARK